MRTSKGSAIAGNHERPKENKCDGCSPRPLVCSRSPRRKLAQLGSMLGFSVERAYNLGLANSGATLSALPAAIAIDTPGFDGRLELELGSGGFWFMIGASKGCWQQLKERSNISRSLGDPRVPVS